MKQTLASLIQWTVFIVFCSCTNAQNENAQNKMDGMAQTAQKLINFLDKSDTANIAKLFYAEADLNEKRQDMSEQCLLFSKVCSKYGKPDIGKIKFMKNQIGENIAYIPLMEKVDSSLNMKRCDLAVGFLPDQFFTPEKIKSFIIFYTPVILPKEELIPLPG